MKNYVTRGGVVLTCAAMLTVVFTLACDATISVTFNDCDHVTVINNAGAIAGQPVMTVQDAKAHISEVGLSSEGQDKLNKAAQDCPKPH